MTQWYLPLSTAGAFPIKVGWGVGLFSLPLQSKARPASFSVNVDATLFSLRTRLLMVAQKLDFPARALAPQVFVIAFFKNAVVRKMLLSEIAIINYWASEQGSRQLSSCFFGSNDLVSEAALFPVATMLIVHILRSQLSFKNYQKKSRYRLENGSDRGCTF